AFLTRRCRHSLFSGIEEEMCPGTWATCFLELGDPMKTDDLQPITITLDRRQLGKGAFAGISAAALAQTMPVAASDRATLWSFFRSQNAGEIPESVDDYVSAALSEDEYATLRAATGRLIPSDE